MKGTYASDRPIRFEDYRNGTGNLYLDETGGANGPGHNLTNLPRANNLPILIDIGEVRISSQFQKGLNDLSQIRDPLQSEQFWDFIATERQVLCTQFYSLEEDTCQRQGGIGRASEFFDGSGVRFPSNDPTAETYGINPQTGEILSTQYWYTGVYFRSFVTGWAIQNGLQLLDQTRFDNRRVPGLNIVPRMNYRAGTTDVEKQQSVPKMFPLLYSVKAGQRDMQIRGGFDPYILEVRMNIKENLMVHTIDRPGGIQQTLVAMSDALSPNQGEPDIGGNLLLRSRVIFPEFAASLRILGGGGNLSYTYAVFHSDEGNILQELPLAATPARADASIRYLNNGRYKLYCLGDLERRDGFPDRVISETEFSVSDGDWRKTVEVNLSCP